MVLFTSSLVYGSTTSYRAPSTNLVPQAADAQQDEISPFPYYFSTSRRPNARTASRLFPPFRALEHADQPTNAFRTCSDLGRSVNQGPDVNRPMVCRYKFSIEQWYIYKGPKTARLDGRSLPVADPEKGTLEPLPLQESLCKEKDGSSVATVVDQLPILKSSGDKKASDDLATKGVVLPSRPTKPSAKPRKKASRRIRFLLWFNTYRKFFCLTFGLNMIGLTLAASGHFPYAIKYSGAMVVANLNFAILMRNEVFGRLLYLFVNTCFAKWPPLWFRLGCTSVLQHLGGIHSGCALSGVIWLLFKVVMNFRHLDVNHDSILILGVVTNIAVMVSALSAFPWVRNTHHNVFERHHRFVGWLGLIATWAFVILGDTYNPATRTWDLNGVDFVHHQDVWFTVGMTILISLPWFFIREVPVDIELPSAKVAIIRFKRGMQQGLLGRISRSSVMEYHAFGIISEARDAEYHYMIAGVQGDFTRNLVNDPPKTLWTRELKFAGVSNTSTLYTRGIRVCTGTGIGAALSTCLQSPNWFLIWIGSDQEKTFGPTISGLIHKHLGPERLILWDSKLRGGRPDTMKILKETYHTWNAEVVFITSNYIGNSEIMEGCKEAGIPAFGTLWDF
ncbi:hypothetical protein Hypma_008792 [Hypsizygus marmoreus]|uniref:Non-ribosomal peptide synthetase n=1 Tax=Hypsizygus marmoreus TaxID=39966 RepID=A0A369K002_HYPMA|nr:hypothetical protein Hypma_008792 [Hypsizygus marmoreus]